MSKNDADELIRGHELTAFDRWPLPSFDPPAAEPEVVEEPPVESAPAVSEVEEIPEPYVKPLTIDELEAIRQDAYNEGFTTGERDGLQAGQLKARQAAEAALAPRLASLEQVMVQLLEPIAEQDRTLEQAMLTLLTYVARQVIQRELLTDSTIIAQVLREALKLLPMGAQNIRIHVNPQDFAQIKQLRERHEENWRILEDDQLLPGGCRIETEHSRIDATIETRLAQAIEQLFEQQRENATNPPPADLDVTLGADDAAP